MLFEIKYMDLGKNISSIILNIDDKKIIIINLIKTC